MKSIDGCPRPPDLQGRRGFRSWSQRSTGFVPPSGSLVLAGLSHLHCHNIHAWHQINFPHHETIVSLITCASMGNFFSFLSQSHISPWHRRLVRNWTISKYRKMPCEFLNLESRSNLEHPAHICSSFVQPAFESQRLPRVFRPS